MQMSAMINENVHAFNGLNNGDAVVDPDDSTSTVVVTAVIVNIQKKVLWGERAHQIAEQWWKKWSE